MATRRRSRWPSIPNVLIFLLGMSSLFGMRWAVLPSMSVIEIPKETDAIVPVLSKKNDTMTLVGNGTYHHNNFLVDFPLCLVHVGKAAGSSVSCGLGLTYADCEGMPRDRLPHVHFFHMRRNQCPPNVTRTFLVTLRNPLTRLQSWFDFERKIVPSRGMNPQVQAQIRQQRAMLFSCFSTFYDFVQVGLQPLDNLTIGNSKPKDMTCPQRAWAAALGVRTFSYHEWYNYEYYWTGIQNKGYSKTQSSLYVLRTEHLKKDWETVSREALFRPVNRRNDGHNYTSKPTHPLFHAPLGNENSTATRLLCHALCPEIQIYKHFLEHAQNLRDAQRQESIAEMQALCPWETTHIRDCPDIPQFPLIKVHKRQYQTEVKKRLYQVKSTPKT